VSTEPALNTEQEQDPNAPNDDARMSFLEHLSELRFRLRSAALIFLGAVIVSFFLFRKYFDILTRPAREAYKTALGTEPVFHFMGPTEPFWVYTKLAIYGALLVSSPFIIWQLWKFVAPGLYRREKRMALLVTASTAFCFLGGAVFGYIMLSKPALTYLFSFAETIGGGDIPVRIEPTIMMEQMVGFMISMLLGTGLAFELPVILGVLGWMGLVSARSLWRFNRYALILSAVVGGIITPSPDVLSQLLMAGPLYGLFNLSIVIVWMIERARKKRLAALEKETGADLMPTSPE
jgi:sec-independent protein translocase protein TatC